MKTVSFSASLKVFLPTLLSIFLTTVGQAQSPRCEGVFSSKIAERVGFQSSVEVEIAATAKVVDLFTTTDGTLAPVMKGASLEALPAELQTALREYVGPEADPLSAPWDVLTSAEKSEVIMASARARNHDFVKSRTVPGLAYRPSIELTFREPTRFLGEDYGRGTYRFSPEAIFGSTAIEYMGPNRMTSDLGFELHVRSDFAAGENLGTARVLQERLTGDQANVHLHMVGARPEIVKPTRLQRFWSFLMKHLRLKFVDAGDAAVFRAADFTRRAMLYFEIRMIERGLPMAPLRNSDDTATNFFPVSPADFLRFNQSLRDGEGGAAVRSKGGTVGLRTSQFYDQSGLWGLEVRYLSPLLDQAVTSQALSGLQAKMVSGDYFLSRAESEAYMAKYGTRRNTFEALTANLLYASSFEAKLKSSSLSESQKDLVRAEAVKNDFVKMLFHDWSHDPMFDGRPARVEQIRTIQNQAVQRLLRGQDSTEVMAFFVKKSALAYEVQGMIQP